MFIWGPHHHDTSCCANMVSLSVLNSTANVLFGLSPLNANADLDHCLGVTH